MALINGIQYQSSNSLYNAVEILKPVFKNYWDFYTSGIQLGAGGVKAIYKGARGVTRQESRKDSLNRIALGSLGIIGGLYLTYAISGIFISPSRA